MNKGLEQLKQEIFNANFLVGYTQIHKVSINRLISFQG